MKNLLLLILLMPAFLMGMHHKSEPIIFYLDMDVAEGKSGMVNDFVEYLVATVKKTEPDTMYYKYWVAEYGSKVSLMEIYPNNEAALFHMNAFAEAPHRDKFLETFIVTNFQVMGDTSNKLKDAMKDYTTDHRVLIDGFKRSKK
jgi:alpha-L-fucosidase